MMDLRLKVASVALTVAALGGAVAIGGGSPPDPSDFLARSRDTADNLEVALGNIRRAANDTEALVAISEDIKRQLDASKRLLDTQLAIEEASRSSVRSAAAVTGEIRTIGRRLREIRTRIRRLTRLASDSGVVAERSADAADELQATLDTLQARFDRLIEESRELNRKARGYEELRDGPR